VEHGGQIRSLSKLDDLVAYAYLDPDLVRLMQDDQARGHLREVLITNHFEPSAQYRLREQGLVNVEAFRYSQVLLTHAVAEATLDIDAYMPAARSQGFRRAVVTAYERRCAFCGIRMMTTDGHSVVDAGHIMPWNLSHNDNPRNGIAVCRLCHWTFDERLMSLSARYLVVLSRQLTAKDNLAGHLLQLDGRAMVGPGQERFLPDPASLVWHRQHVFRHR
jgi:putative restriction endonuclease